MITILILDDSEIKTVQVSQLVRSMSIIAEIYIASDIHSAKSLLNRLFFDILVLDMYLPLRSGEEIISTGGEILLKEISRSKINNIPRVVFGLSAYNTTNSNLFWPFFHYNDSNDWCRPFKSMMNYVELYSKKYNVNDLSERLVSSVYVEGVTDFMILDYCIRSFRPELQSSLSIRYESGSGASWVLRQLLATVFLLPKKNNGENIRCAALFDDDKIGNDCINRINEIIPQNSAERNHFRIFKLHKKYSPILRLFKNLELIELEDLLPPKAWIAASESGWLVKREKAKFKVGEICIEDLFDACKFIEPDISKEQLVEYLNIYSLKTIPDENKKKVVNDLLKREISLLTTALLPFQLLINDIAKYLLLPSP